MVAMETAISQHVPHLGFFKDFIFSKTAAKFFEISRKHVFTASNRNIIRNRVEKKKLHVEQILSKVTVFL